MSTDLLADDSGLPTPGRLPGATYVLFFCQAVNLTAAVISVTIAALVGAKMAPNPALATVPYGLQFAVVAVLTYPAAGFMRRFSRKAGFLLGATLLIAAGLVGYGAVNRSSFIGLVVAHALLGAYVAFANYYRFAAVDNLPSELRSKGLSLVVAGGIVAAVTGPLVSIGLQDVAGFSPYSLCYASFIVLGLVTMGLMSVWRPGAPIIRKTRQGQYSVAAFTAPLFLAVFASASGYFIMNLLMVQASLVMETMCVSFKVNTLAVQGHVIAMFAPSFVTGALISKIGFRKTLLAGFVLLIAASFLGMWNLGLAAMVVGLLLLGVGWNLSYVGGGALLAGYLTDQTRHRLQGINDSVIAICATFGAFAPSLLQTTIGWQNTNLLCLCISAVGCVLTWTILRNRLPPKAQ
jgi:MFS family permease